MLLSEEEWNQRFDDFERSAWRFETQPTYAMPREQENIQQFLTGEPMPEGHNAPWHERVRAMVAAGKSIGRVRTVKYPLTDYQRYWLAWAVPGNTEAGEDIRILDLTNLELNLPSQDFWMFDEAEVVHLNFRPDGTLINVDRQDSPDIGQYIRLRDVAQAHAVRFNDWNART